MTGGNGNRGTSFDELIRIGGDFVMQVARYESRLDAPLRVVILGQDALVLRGLRSMFQEREGIRIVAESADHADALRQTIAHRADILLITLQWVQSTGPDFIATVRRESPPTRTIITGTFDDRETIVESLRYGAAGYISSQSDADQFESMFRQALVSKEPVISEVASDLLFYVLIGANGQQEPAGRPLTPREREVLECVAKGMSNKDIAAALFVSVRTVKAHISNILQKLEVSDRTHAVVEGLRRGIVDV